MEPVASAQGGGTGVGVAARALLVAALLFAAHVGLVLHFTPTGLTKLPVPLFTSAFAVEAYRSDRTVHALAAGGRLATYDPLVLAGQPAGLVEPLGTRALPLGTAGLVRLGVSEVVAFDTLALVMHVLVPLVGFLAARRFGLDRGGSIAVLGVFSALTFVDALTHYAWFSGRMSFVLASALVVLEAACAHRFSVTRSAGAALSLLLSAAAAVLAHPVVALYGAGALLLVAAVERAATSSRRFAPFAVALLPLAIVGTGSLAAPFSEPLGTAFDVGPASLFWDLVEIPGPGYGAAGASRTLLRVASLGAGVVGVMRLGREHDSRAPHFGVLVALGLAVAYLGGLLPVAWPVDPYYFAIPATFAAVLPAVETVRRVPWSSLARRGPHAIRVVVAAGAVLVTARCVRTVLTYAPELLPARVIHGPDDVALSALAGINEPFPDPLGYDPPTAELAHVAAFIAEHGGDAGRVVVDDATLAAFLAFTSNLSVLGPLGERGSRTAAADPTSLVEQNADTVRVHAFLERYGVRLVVTSGPPGPFDRDDPWLGPVEAVHGYRVRPVVHPTSLVASGSARVSGVTRGAIHVTDASGPSVVLRFHFDERLACRPGCRAERAQVPGDAAGFVMVRAPPSEFELFPQ